MGCAAWTRGATVLARARVVWLRAAAPLHHNAMAPTGRHEGTFVLLVLMSTTRRSTTRRSGVFVLWP